MTEVAAPRRSNRRLTARRACRLGVRYRTGAPWHPATAMDLSTSGCRLRLGEDLARGGAVSVRFEAPQGEAQMVEAAGTVIWCRHEGLSYQAGILFGEEPAGIAEILGALA